MRGPGPIDQGGSRRGAVALAVALLISMLAPAASADDLDSRRADKGSDSASARLSTSLARSAAAVTQRRGPATRSAPGLVDVELVPSSGQGPGLSAWLKNSGAADVVQLGDIISARIPPGLVAQLGADSRVAYAQHATRPRLEVVGEGVAFMGADDWHAVGLTGAGITVAVVDLGFSGYSALLGSELPASVETQNYCNAGFESSTAHGTAVAEIVHEVAPDADLHLICIDSLGDLAQAVDYATTQGVDVINHSVGWFNTGRGDGTGWMESIVEDARDGGILWVNSGGNYADEHWMGTFVDGDTDGYMEWSGTDETNSVTLAGGETIDLIMRWDDWPSTSLDYDLLLLDSSLSVVASSEDVQSGSQPPTEELTYTNPGGSATFHVAIFKYSGPATTPQIDLFLLGGDPEYLVEAGSLVEPASSPIVTAVGAVNVNDGVVEYFSSRGPTIDGRIKPDISAPDRISGVTYGSPNGFGGTSAAAPNAAGLAALLLERNPTLSTAELADLLESVVTDAGDPGADNDYGEGVLDDVDIVGPPAVDAGADDAVQATAEWTGAGSFTDLGGTGWTATVDWGDGGGAEALTLDGMDFDLSHTWSTAGTRTVTVAVTDEDGDVGTDTVEVDVTDPPDGLLRVVTSPAVASQIWIDGVPANTWGLDWLKLAPGDYQVSFTDVGGFSTPGSDTVTIVAGATTALSGEFVPRGWLKVTTDPAVPATITIDGTPRNDWGVWTDFEPGDYEVCFGAVADHDPPPCETVTLAAGSTTELTAAYTANPGAAGPTGFGMLRVTTSPPVASQIMVDGVAYDSWGLNWVKVAPGDYDVSFTDVAGYVTPTTQTVTVVDGATTEVTGTFVPRGWLRVTTDPAVPSTIEVDGAPRNDWGMWTDLDPGDYDVCFGEVDTYTTPSCETITLVAGSTTDVVGTFSTP